MVDSSPFRQVSNTAGKDSSRKAGMLVYKKLYGVDMDAERAMPEI
jgi:hypothetical protein